MGTDPGNTWHWTQHDLVTDWMEGYRRAGTHGDWGSLAWASGARIVEPFIVRGVEGWKRGGPGCSMAGEGSELSFRLANLEASRPGGKRCLGRWLHESGIQERP